MLELISENTVVVFLMYMTLDLKPYAHPRTNGTDHIPVTVTFLSGNLIRNSYSHAALWLPWPYETPEALRDSMFLPTILVPAVTTFPNKAVYTHTNPLL